jgi:V/A-type H+-transporting ATPase subunit G/H
LSRTDILSEIKGAETKADAKVAEAEESKRDAVADARRDSIKRIEDAAEDIRSNHESIMAKTNAELDIERESKLAAGEKEAADVEARSEGKSKEVIDLLIGKFEEIIDGAS